jgi:REP element-mobilizing transposase RayT
VRKPRDYGPQQLYAVTQRGNGGQWVYRDPEDFEHALALMRRYSKMHDVAIHGYCLLHNHAHWILEASTPDSISNFMRDLQGRYSYYLNRKYKETPWLLIAPLFGCRDIQHVSPYLRMGPMNWTSRYDARFLDGRGFKEFLRYLENNAVDAELVERAVDWPWSSAKAHCDGVDGDDLLSFDRWRHVFGRPETIAADWMVYLEGPREELRRNSGRLRSFHTRSRHNRPARWVAAAPG